MGDSPPTGTGTGIPRNLLKGDWFGDGGGDGERGRGWNCHIRPLPGPLPSLEVQFRVGESAYHDNGGKRIIKKGRVVTIDMNSVCPYPLPWHYGGSALRASPAARMDSGLGGGGGGVWEKSGLPAAEGSPGKRWGPRDWAAPRWSSARASARGRWHHG
ncbi:hypothetical protein L3X38_001159 [Prunus dulcis]|uniref:Uncharacterized protein n=1 Tax=Prunus dulcis TaxID=3755 RepID=A0AAD4WU08_PRUDU|nr:hypothetical protein L3X38_001159 [Prunus dulcis]